MDIILKILIGLSALAFALAVICSVTQCYLLGISPEAFSRACNNLALLAIALAVGVKKAAE